jgi:ribonuclease BN (tRNA processing enzyme)
VIAVLLVVVGSAGRPARPRPTALLPPRSNGKPEAAAAVVVAPDDGHEVARNMLSCSISIAKLMHLFIKSYHHSHLKLQTLKMSVMHY